MAFELPRTVLPVWRLTVHIVLGAIAFLIVFMVAVGVGWWVDWMESKGAHAWVIEYARWGETAILWLDLLGLHYFCSKSSLSSEDMSYSKTGKSEMSKIRQRKAQSELTFTFDGDFIKREAKEALKSYFFPFSGLYAAVTGREVIFVRRDAKGRIIRDREVEKKQA